MKKTLFIFVLLTIALRLCAAGDVQFTVTAPKAVVKGQQFRISYTVNTQKVKNFRAPSFGDGFEVLMGPSESRSSSTSIINGEVTSSTTITYTYIVLGVSEGEYTIPAATIVADGEQCTSNNLKIKVLPPDQTAATQSASGTAGRGGGQASSSSSASQSGQISDRDLFITATVNKANVYEQEAILLTYKVYFTVNLRSLEIKMPDLKGFHTQEVELQRGEPQLEHYNGRNYNTIVWSQYVLFPQQTGKLEIPSINFEGVVAVRTLRSMDPFDIFMNGGTGYVYVRKNISTPKLSVNVSPLPAGKPSSFMGGVGEFSMKSSLSSTNLKANDAVTLQLEISGVGNMKLINTPEVQWPQDFEAYDPKVENKFSLTRSGLSGKKVIEYLAIPRHAGTFTVPPVEFSYFDLKTKSYKTLTTESYTLQVSKGEGGADAPVVSGYMPKEDLKLIGQDVRYIKSSGDVSFRPRGQYFFGSVACWLWYVVSLLLFLAMVVLHRKRAAENADLARVKTKKANKVAVRRLKVASKLMKENKTADFYDEVLKASWGYVSDKLGIPVADLTKDNIKQELIVRGADKTLCDEFLDLLNQCEFARYAPAAVVGGGMDKVYEIAVSVIGRMEKMKKFNIRK